MLEEETDVWVYEPENIGFKRYVDLLCQLLSVDKIDYNNGRELWPRILELYKDREERKEIYRELGLEEHTIYIYNQFLSDLPRWQQGRYIKAFYEVADGEITTYETALKKANLQGQIGTYRIPLITLELIEPVDQYRFRSEKELYELRWPDIALFSPEYNTRKPKRKIEEPKKANRREMGKERVDQALKIMGVNSIEEASEEMIKNLSRIDFKLSNIDLPQGRISKLKSRLISMKREASQYRLINF